jgi:hypothetical protein
VKSKRKTIAPARTASPAILATRPIGTPSTAADAEGHGLGVALLISRGMPCGCRTMARGWHRCGTGPPTAADAERWHAPDQNSDHGHGLLRMRNRSSVPIPDWHKNRRTICPTDKPSLWEGLETIGLAYMISPAYRSTRNDKFCLYSTNVLLRMILIFRKYTCTNFLDTLVASSYTLAAGSNFFCNTLPASPYTLAAGSDFQRGRSPLHCQGTRGRE